jgi:hypothetical protein
MQDLRAAKLIAASVLLSGGANNTALSQRGGGLATFSLVIAFLKGAYPCCRIAF